MANNFNILARVQLQGPNNIRQVARQIQAQLTGIRATVNVNIANGTNRRLNTLNTNLQRINNSLGQITLSAVRANQELLNLSNTIQQLRNANRNINVHTRINQAANSAANAANQMRVFGEQAALAVRRFAAFAIPTSIFLGLVTAIKEGVSASIEFEKEMVRLSQVTGKGLSALTGLSNEITRLSTSLGVSSKDLGNVATTLAQAGLSAKKTTVALEALARSSLAATFTSIEDTTEGAIAVFRQFNVEAEDLQGVIGSLNAVSAQFAVESDDLVSVIRRTGGAFKASGGELNELLGLFTSVRATTRESADSIATGFRTIFTRIQRPRTIQFLKELGVELQDAKGQFIGPLESIRKLNAALKDVPTTDPRFASVIEELGGFRQVSKVIPLIQQFPEALKAISVAEQGQNSIVEDSITAQKSLSNQIAKVREEFLALFRELTSDKSFQFFVRTVLDLAKGLIDVTRAIKPLIPLLGSIALIQTARSLGGLGQGFVSGLSGQRGGRRFAEGGVVPGTGNGDTVPAMLTPGEFVVKKSAAKAIGFDRLARMNKFAKGGKVDDEVAIAGLIPKGGINGSRIARTENFKFNDGKLKKNVRIHVGVLNEQISNQLEGIYKKGIYSSTSKASEVLQSKLKIKKNNNTTKIETIAQKAGLDSVVGNLFEQSLALAGAPYDEKTNDRDPIDFRAGLGAELAGGFGIPQAANFPTDAKRTADSKDFRRRNLVSYLYKKYAADIEAASSAKNKGRNPIKNIGDEEIPVKTQKTQEYIQQKYNSLDDEQKKKVNDIVSGKTKFSSSASFLSGLGFRYAKKGQIGALNIKKFAEGGDIPGTGNTDNVPALLTPGEFVINKRAAQKLGDSTLRQLNNADKPKKFARGGRVQRFAGGGTVNDSPLTSNFEKVFLVTTLIGSLSSSLGELDEKTKKVAESLTAVIASSTALSFGLRSFASDRKLELLSHGSTFNFGAGKQLPFSKQSQFLAKNFDTLSAGVGIASSALVVFGQSMQDSALAAAKNAKSQAELDQALTQNNRGSTLAGAGVGAGIGAAIGTVIAPGIGTAIGAGVGALTGGIVGALNDNSKELIAAFNQAGFDRTTEKLGDLFDDFSSKRKSVGESALNIGSEASSALNIIKNTSDIEQRQNLTKELKGQIVNYRSLSSAIVENVSDLNQFKNAYGSSGQKLIESISFLTNKSIKEVEDSIQKEIDARNISVRAIQQQAAANTQLKALTVSISTLSESFQSISDSVNAAQDSIDELIASTEGSFSNAKVNSDIPGDFFARAASGNIRDIGAVSAATKRLTVSLDSESQNEIVNQVTSVAKLANELPNIIRAVANNTGLSGDTDSAEQQFSAAIDRLEGVDNSIKSVVKNLFGSEIASRESSGDSGFKKTSREDLLGLADKLLPDALKSFVQELDNINKSTQNIFNTINDRMVKANQLQLNISKKRADIEGRIFELSKFRLAENKDVQLADVQNTVANKRNFLIQSTGLRPGAGAAEAFNRLSQKIQERESARQAVQTAGPGEAQVKAQKVFDAANNEVVRLTEYMKDLASSTEELSFLQDKLSKQEQDRAAGRSLIQDALFGSGANRVKFVDTAQNINDVRNGNKKLLDLPEDKRNDFFELISKLPQNKESKFLGGVKPEDFINKQIRESLIEKAKREGTDPQKALELADDFTQRSKEENDTRAKIDKLMQDQITAESLLTTALDNAAAAFDRFNVQSLEQLPQLLTNAIAGAQAKQFEELQKAKGDELTTAKDKKALAENLAIQLGVPTSKFQSAGQRIEANRANFEQLRKSKEDFDRFKLQNNASANKLFSDQVKYGETKTSYTGVGTFLNENQAMKLASDAIDNDPTYKNDANKEKRKIELAQKLQKYTFANTNSNPMKDNFSGRYIAGLEGRVGPAKNRVPYSSGNFNNAINGVLDYLIRDIKISDLQQSNVKGYEANTQLQNNLKGEFGANTQKIIEQFLDPTKLKAFTDSFAQVNQPFDTLEQNTINLGSQFTSLGEKVKFYNDQIKDVPNTTLSSGIGGVAQRIKAQQKAAGGWINGRSINSPLTTFSPKGSDKIPAILSRGEFVVNAAAAKANAGLLNTINAQGYARGGRVKMTAEEYQARQEAKRSAYQKSKFDKKMAFYKTPQGQSALFNSIRKSNYAAERKKQLIAEYDFNKNKDKYKNIGANLIGTAVQGLFSFGTKNKPQSLPLPVENKQEKLLLSKSDDAIGNLFPNIKQAEDDRKIRELGQQGLERFRLFKARDNYNRGLPNLQRQIEERIKNKTTQPRTLQSVAIEKDLDERIRKRTEELRLNNLRKAAGFADGGPVPGAGNRDTVPALLTPGEFVLNRRAAKSLGLNSLSNFNQKFASGGVVTGGGGGGAGGTLNINPQSLAVLEKFYGTFTDAVSQFGSSIGIFTQAGNSLASALSNWGGAATRLSEALSSMPHEIQVSHAPMNVVISVSGLETFRQEITNEVLAAMDQRLASQRTKAADGKSPFMSK